MDDVFSVVFEYDIIIKISNSYCCKICYESLLISRLLLLIVSWGYSSVAEHSTADREVAGSTPAAPFFNFKRV